MTSPDGVYDWLAVAAVAVALVALVVLIANNVSLRRLRRAQKIVLAGSERDVVRHAADLQREFTLLRDWIDETSEVIDARMRAAEERLDGSVSHTAMLRYDAYGELTGRQSSSVAFVDDTRTGVIITAIRHRSHSHLYVKQLHNGESDIELSPEERQVLDQAFSDRPVPAAAPAAPEPPERGPATSGPAASAPAVPEAPTPPGVSAPPKAPAPPEAEPRVSANPPRQVSS